MLIFLMTLSIVKKVSSQLARKSVSLKYSLNASRSLWSLTSSEEPCSFKALVILFVSSRSRKSPSSPEVNRSLEKK